MRRVFVIATIAVFFLLISMVPIHLTGAQNKGAVDKFTIYISEAGENETSGNLTLGPIAQGDTVIITFVWNDTNSPWNTHQMEIDGYNITTDVISQQTPTSVVQFSADMVGAFRIYCVIPCQGMDNMQNGWLVVVPATTSTSSSSNDTTSNSTSNNTITGTNLSFLSINTNDSELLASIRLSDSNGTPIAGVQVQFSVPTDFGKMSIGTRTTDSNGTANLAYQLPSHWGGLLYASYPGSRSYAPSNVTAAIQYDPNVSDPRSPYVSGQGNSIDLRLVGVPSIPAEVVMGIFTLVIGSVYVVIAYALIHVLAITRKRGTRNDK
ncbi:MAG: hypothetical protein M1587_06935 [Thaumarchaeota archaeon]|nr:hypothetical protein [Nitrososphaerota archaeon]